MTDTPHSANAVSCPSTRGENTIRYALGDKPAKMGRQPARVPCTVTYVLTGRQGPHETVLDFGIIYQKVGGLAPVTAAAWHGEDVAAVGLGDGVHHGQSEAG